MQLKTLSKEEFDTFTLTSPLGNFYQLSNYASFTVKEGNNFNILGLVDEENKIHAAALIIIIKKGIFNYYGYSPRGFIIDYYNVPLLTEFTKKIKEYYQDKNVSYIKINPEISIANIDYKNKISSIDKNEMIENILAGLNYRKIDDNKRFSNLLPKYNAIQVLSNTNLNTVSKNTRNKINKTKNIGLTLVKGNRDSIKTLYEFVKKKNQYPLEHYLNFYDSYKDLMDVFLVEINFEEYLMSLRKQFEKELNTKNAERIKENIRLATIEMGKNRKRYIAGALVIRYKNRVTILTSGYNTAYKKYNPNYFLHYELMKYYQKDYDYMDLNGISGDLTKENPFKGLDTFKAGFNPLTFEYIGEYDLIINEKKY